jgi:FtsP/CotA-like multicopper oxidase with cupredoxin domain
VNSGQRIAILVGAVVILAVGFVLAQGSDDEGGQEADRTPAEQTVAQDEAANTETSGGTGGAEAPTTPTEAAPAPAPRVDSVRISDGQPAGGKAKTLKYESGDTVRIRFTAESGASEIHIHGYDKTVEVPAGQSETVRFKANAEGIFEIEDHHTEALLAKLEVRP